jgi:4-aminobutyrate aminotransferase
VLPPPGWLTAVRDLYTKYGIIMVADEVQCGVGRTGKMWACDHEGVEPDILITSKGLGSGMPIGAIVAKESISTWEHGAHGSTFGGNPVCCAAAIATLDIIERELVTNAKSRGEQLSAGLKKLAEKHGSIGEVRGVGLMQGIEFVMDRGTREPAGDMVTRLERMAFAQGLLVLAAGKNTLRLAPPLVVDAEDVEIALAILDQCLSALD